MKISKCKIVRLGGTVAVVAVCVAGVDHLSGEVRIAQVTQPTQAIAPDVSLSPAKEQTSKTVSTESSSDTNF